MESLRNISLISHLSTCLRFYGYQSTKAKRHLPNKQSKISQYFKNTLTFLQTQRLRDQELIQQESFQT